MDQSRLLDIWNYFNRILDDCTDASSAYDRLVKVLFDFGHDQLPIPAEHIIQQDVTDTIQWLASIPIKGNTQAIWIDLMKYDNSYYGFIAKQCKQYSPENNFWNQNPLHVHQQVLILDGNEMIVKAVGNHEELDWILPISYSAFVLTEAVSKINKLNPKSDSLIEISIGYVNGDFIGVLPLMNSNNGKLS